MFRVDMEKLIEKESNRYAKRFYNKLYSEGYELISGRYKRAKTSVEVKHIECGEVFATNSDRFLNQGGRCPKCSRKIGGKKRRAKSKKNFENVVEKNGYKIIGEYTDASTHVEIKHLKCGYEYAVLPSNFLGRPNKKGTRCPQCHYAKLREIKIVSSEEFQERVWKHTDKSFMVLGEYKGNSKKILLQHISEQCDNHVWETTPRNFLSRKGNCPVCTGRIRTRSQAYFEKEIFELVGDEYTVLGKFIDTKKPILFRHNSDKCGNYEYKVSHDGFTSNGNRCPKCFGNLRGTTERFKREVFDKYGEKYTVIGEYVNAKTHVLVRHNSKECNFNTWKVLPNNLLGKESGCPACVESSGEKEIRLYLQNNEYTFENQKTFEDLVYINKLRYDFYLTELNILIEMDGEHHFYPVDFANKGEEWALGKFKSTLKRDRLKNNYAIDNNIPLIRIPYWERESISIILQDFLQNFETRDFKYDKYYIDSKEKKENYLSLNRFIKI